MKNNMVFEEDIEAATRTARRILGAPGRMLYRPASRQDVVPNAVIMTKEHGRLWYGDLEVQDADKLNALSTALKTVVGMGYEGTLTFAQANVVFER
jgi:hypothetical protein